MMKNDLHKDFILTSMGFILTDGFYTALSVDPSTIVDVQAEVDTSVSRPLRRNPHYNVIFGDTVSDFRSLNDL